MIRKFFGWIKKTYSRIFATNRIAGIGAVVLTIYVIYSCLIFVYSSFNPIQQQDKTLPDISTMEISTTKANAEEKEEIYYINVTQIGDSITIDVGVEDGIGEQQAIDLAIEVIHQFEADQGWTIPEGQIWSNELKQFEVDITIDKVAESETFPIFGTKMQNVDTINWLFKDGTRKAQYGVE